jgi:predicted ATPase
MLGPVDVFGDDGTVRQSGSALRRTLLSLLALHRGEVLSPDWLLEHVWGEEQPDSGVRALRFHVSQLRKDVGAVVSIETRPGGYLLDVPAGSVDVLVFEAIAREARTEVDDVRSSAFCSEALGLWRGAPWVHRVAPLDRPAAVELFTNRALAADSTFALDDADHETVGTLCERLDGVPLAIELAAARVRSMSPTELLQHLDDRFRLLRGTARGRHDRHQTLRAAVAWSYQLLTDDERIVFERASVFAGSFDLAAAKAVCSGDMIDHADVMHLLAGLVDKSIVVAERRAIGMRYRLLETLREFGEEQLVARADGHGPHDRHLCHYVEVAAHADRIFRGPREVEAGQMFDVEWDNLRAAHAWSIVTKDLDQAERLLAATFAYASSRARSETADWVERTLTLETEHRQPNPHTYGQAAWWANMAELDEPQHRWAQRGIDTAPSPDHPSTALCWSLVRTAQHDAFRTPGPINQLETAVAGLDLDHDWWALVMLADAATPSPRQRDQLGRQAEGTQARLRRQADRGRRPSRLAEPSSQHRAIAGP